MFSAASKTSSQPAAIPNYIEEVFSTYLYTGTGATQTINNGIDLAGKGGLTWIKDRTNAGYPHVLFDTARGAQKALISNSSNTGYPNATDALTAFTSSGFSLGTDITTQSANYIVGASYCSWSFRKQPKFFDAVTWSGNSTNRTISHSLGSVPGMIIVKRTDSGPSDWQVYHRSLANTEYLVLNTTAAKATGATRWNSTTPTSTEFSLGTDATVNASGGTYVAYLFAHDAGGFGTAGTDNVISCGSFTTDGTGKATVSLGYEPQYVLWKQTDGADNWYVNDVMRGMNLTQYNNNLSPNLSAAESAGGYDTNPNATGFIANPGIASKTYIYMAIRRPMKVPTDATTVFVPRSQTGGGTVTTNFVVDSSMSNVRAGNGAYFFDRLRGTSTTDAWRLTPTSTGAEANVASGMGFDNNTGYVDAYYASGTIIYWNFSRRPGFFDTVCYTGTGSARTVAHNLGVVPELMIVKSRSTAELWAVYSSSTGNANFLRLNTTAAVQSSTTMWDNTTPTSSVFSTANNTINASGVTHVAYLFATCAGVSKVGSYTGNGGTQAIACGFTGGARFVLIKRTDATGSWYVYDTARGMTTLTDPYLLMESTAGEVATLGSVTTTTGGFTVDATILAAINASGGNYIFLAIA